jgi:hypothetical protein
MADKRKFVNNVVENKFSLHVVQCKKTPGFAWKKQHATRRFFSPEFGFQFKEETSHVLHLEHNLYGAESWTVWKVDQKYLKSF